MDKMRMESVDMVSENIEKIGALFPNCITEAEGPDGKLKKAINFDLLRQMLSDDVAAGSEAYEFTWVGKKASIVEANRSIRKTLRPCPEESVNWDETENLYIEGDNLEVLKLLQESYLGKVKMIYIDPPYNTGSDFIYRDDFKQSVDEYEVDQGLIDEETGDRLFKNTDTNGRFHSDWCSMMYSRLMLARSLLTDDGVIFISIDDNEQENLKKICDEIFGENNFISNIIWQSTAGSNTGTEIVTVTENILVYTKKRSLITFDGKPSSEDDYTLEDEYVNVRGKYSLDKLDRRRVGSHYSPALNFSLEMPDGTIRFPGGGDYPQDGWNYLWSKKKIQWGIDNGYIVFKQVNGVWGVYNKRYSKVNNEGKEIERSTPYRNLILSSQFNTAQGTADIRSLFKNRPFDFPKPKDLIKHLLLTTVRSNSSAIVLDFFSGSASTAHAVMQLNAEDGGSRKFILVQLPEPCDEKSEAYKAGYKTICEIGKERIRRAGAKIKEENPLAAQNLDTGFRVLKLDDSNMEDVYYAADTLSQANVGNMLNNIKLGRTPLDLLFGCLLEWGLPLSLPYTVEEIDSFKVHTYNDGDLIACFDSYVSEECIKAIAKRRPLRAVFRDSCFQNSADKINVFELFKLLAPETSIKVL